MDHNQFSDMILDYINGRLDEKVRLEFQAHILDCDNCTEELLLQKYIFKKLENGSVSQKLRERFEKTTNSVAYDVAFEDEKHYKIAKKEFNHHIRRGEEYIKKRNREEAVLAFNMALETFNKALEIFKKDINVRHKVSRLYLAIGIIQQDELFIDKAIAELKIMKEIDPTFFYAYENLSFIYYHRGEIDDAISELSEALKFKSDDANLYLFLWALYIIQGNLQQAIDQAKKALEIQPDNPEGYLSMAKTYLRMGSYNEAITYSKKIIELFPKNTSGPIVLACAYEKKEMVEEAINEFEKVKKIDSKKVEPYTFLSRIYINTGNVDKAVEELEKAFKINPKDAQTNLGRGIAYTLQKKFDKAIESLNSVPVDTNEFAISTILLGYTYMMTKEFDTAINYFKKCMDVKELEYDSRYGIALSLSAIGEDYKAILEFEKVIKLKKNNADAFHNIGLIYAKNKEYDKAVKYLLRALEINEADNELLNDYKFVKQERERQKKGKKDSSDNIKLRKPDIISQHLFTDSIMEKLSSVFVSFLILPKKYKMNRSILYPIGTKNYLYPTIFKTVR